jgi:hypothetical protein
MDDIKKNFVETPISPKLRALLDIAGKVQKEVNTFYQRISP